jgi:hypothetical protein
VVDTGRSLKVAAGVLLMPFFSPFAIGAVVVTGMVIPVYGIEPQMGGYMLGWCAAIGLPSLFMCIVGVQLVCRNIRDARDNER